MSLFTLADNPFSLVLFILAILGSIEFGYRQGSRQRTKEKADNAKGRSVLNGSVYGLLGLLIAFTFSGAASRFEGRRHLVVEEANNLGTAWLRLDLLEPEPRAELKTLLWDFLNIRIESYRARDLTQFKKGVDERTLLQASIWKKAVDACKESNSPALIGSVLPPLNAVFDTMTKEIAATQNHPPLVIFYVLGGLMLVGAFLAGFEMGSEGRRCWLHSLCYTLVLGVTLFVIIDLEHPRIGSIKVDNADEILISLRDSLKGHVPHQPTRP